MTDDKLFNIITGNTSLAISDITAMSEEERGKLLDTFKAVSDKFEAVKRTFIQFILAGNKVDGWCVREGAKRINISDPLQCYQILKMHCHMSQDELIELSNIPIGKLQDFFQSEKARVKLSPEELRDLIRPSVTSIQVSPTLAKSKS